MALQYALCVDHIKMACSCVFVGVDQPSLERQESLLPFYIHAMYPHLHNTFAAENISTWNIEHCDTHSAKDNIKSMYSL